MRSIDRFLWLIIKVDGRPVMSAIDLNQSCRSAMTVFGSIGRGGL